MEYVPPLNGNLADPNRPYVNADPGSGIEGSIPPADAIENPMREIVAAIAAAGLVPDDADLTQLAAAIVKIGADAATRPLAALAYPSVADGLIGPGATGVAGASGGTVTLPAGVNVVIARETAVSSGLGRMVRTTTPAFVSGVLAINTTYYLRLNIDSVTGAATAYLQRGTEGDIAPASLRGTPNAAAGGGFDSTKVDALLARVATGAAGSVPAVTNLVNKAVLQGRYLADFDQTRTTGPNGALAIAIPALTLNWARAPTVYAGSLARVRFAGSMAVTPEDPRLIYSGAGAVDGTGTLTASVSRYAFAPTGFEDTNQNSTSLTLGFVAEFVLAADQ